MTSALAPLSTVKKKRNLDQIEFYPTFGRYHSETSEWELVICGRTVKPRPDNLRRKMLLRLMRRALKIHPERMNSPLLRDRLRGFLMLAGKRKRIRFEMGDSVFQLNKRSKPNGHFASAVHLDAAEAEHLTLGSEPDRRSVSIRPAMGTHDSDYGLGRVHLIQPVGPSVISDIDDTIKVTNVGSPRALLASTFLHPFQPISGMSDLYRDWEEAGCAFHYVSSSPWSLYRPLAEFLGREAFPAGSFHLRAIRLRDPSVLQLVIGRKRSKRTAIQQILRWYPRRHFVLMGDAGEKDPELYGSIARKYPQQVAQICIRRVAYRRLKPERVARAFRRVPRSVWRFFDDPAELGDLRPLPDSGWICR